MGFEDLDREYEERKTNTNPSYIDQTKTTNYSRRISYGTDEVVSVGVWIGISLLIGLIGIIPVIGPFAALGILIAMAFMDINQNIKNWARASLILGIVAGVIVLIFLLG